MVFDNNSRIAELEVQIDEMDKLIVSRFNEIDPAYIDDLAMRIQC